MKLSYRLQKGQSLVELLLAIGLLAILIPALFAGLIASRQGKAQQIQRLQAVTVLRETNDAIRSIRESGWSNFATNGTFHPAIGGNSWAFASGSITDSSGFTKQVVISDVYRLNGAIVASGTNGATVDPSTKQAVTTVSWGLPYISTLTTTSYITRYLDNLAYVQTTAQDFNADSLTQTQVVPTGPPTADAAISIQNNTKAKWCSPSLSPSTIDLPDGPPVAVAATASATVTIPNDVFVATSPTATNSVKLAYVQVPANVDPPAPVLRGTFTLDATKYSAGTYPSGINLTNNFQTNDVKFYKESNGKVYAFLATNLPDHEIVVVQINNGSGDAWQDPTNHIYKYWTYFNTRQYQGDNRSMPNQDQAPFGYGAGAITISGTRGYVESGGYLYVFDLSNIDSKTSASGLDEIGCRVQLDGYDCQPGNGTDRKYNAGQTGGSWSDTTSATHLDCSDGGNIELYADHQMSAVTVGGSTYIYVAVGAATNPELDIVNVTSVPTNVSSPKINSNSCGRGSGGNSGWKVTGSLDFDPAPNTEEAANSVFAKSDGTRAYMSSNGGIIHNGIPDSDQFYVIDTTNKSSPQFLTTWPTDVNGQHYANTAETGYYNGDTTNIELYPRRALTVLNGQRVVLVGQDGIPNDGIEPQEYQVLDLQKNGEASPTYCGGLNFLAGFNDLTSVSEADGDNFVYMVANTLQKQLKIIQGGPDGTYLDQGTVESHTLDAGYSTAFNKYTAHFTTPTNTNIQFQFSGADPVNGSCTNANFVYTGPDGSTGTYYTSSSGPIFLSPGSGGYKNPARCFRYKAFMSTTDYNATPLLQDMTVNYSP